MIDAHVHVLPGDPQPLLDRLDAAGARRFNVLGVNSLFGADNNLLCLRLKQLRPGRAYAFGGLQWVGSHCPQPERQLELMLAAGFDGLKLLETKPNVQKHTGFLPDSPAFSAMFSLAEQQGVPIMWHVGDPAPFWHVHLAPQFAIDNGWTYEGEGFLSLGALYHHTENVLSRHPRLQVILAHLYFCSDDRAHLSRLFEQHPGAHIDITPGSEMYRDFAADRAGWQTFFREHHQRILLGTDTTNQPGDEGLHALAALTRGLLKPEDFPIWEISMRGFDLSPDQVSAITEGNFKRLAGDSPKPVHDEGLRELMAFYRQHLSASQYEACRNTYEEFFV